MDDVIEVGSELLGNGPATFPSLEILKFKSMPLWEVWSVNAMGVAVFPCLKELHIECCCNMARWEVRSADVGVFPCLEKLWINDCPNLVELSLEALPSLRVLHIKSCADVLLKSLVGVASSVTKLRIERISGLTDEVWGGVVRYIGAVEQLSISYCYEIRNLWEISRCEKLARIGGGEKEEEEEKEEESNFPTSLRMLTIWGCKNLKRLNCRDSIETLDISFCENMEHLSCQANSIQELNMFDCSITSVSFPTKEAGGGGEWQKFKSLNIRGCNSELGKELEKQVLIIKNMPMFEAVVVSGWENLKSMTKFTCFIQLLKLEVEDCGRIESFPDLQDLVLLKHLKIKNCRSMDVPPPLGCWPPKLDSLEIGGLKRPISEWGPLPTSLVKLSLWGGFGSSLAEEEEDVKSLPTSILPHSLSSSLATLGLYGFKKIERISSGLQHLTSLQYLWFGGCPKLKDLPETLMPSLLILSIYDCDELKEKMLSKSGSYWPLLSLIPRVDTT